MFKLLSTYIPTPLEDAVVQFYRRHLIKSPQDIDLEMFAYEASIWVHYVPHPSNNFHFRDSIYTIAVDNRIPWEQQRVGLAHELGHVLLHSGSQEFMNDDFRALQEFQADRFAMFALAPTFMLANYITQASSRQQLVSQLAYSFDVPEIFMDARIDLLEQRLKDIAMQRQMEEVVKEQAASYDYSYRHPLNDKIEYLVRDGAIVGRRRRAGY
ncbi:ImmA/IrrE family metallo-endopeptidase [Alicyclobacillus sp. SO9]|uniref:ImmA/IrrE family metallo-endopeptidase n=1 Tax=Alicyclobacillus sp. SO9 TaxID=2665646 RepID=UPI0018E72F40|nr:ImmA/IrrE family metallo-endopeptidase [Alicyclobacillus sp. SO9]QQE78100.1 ImmA/IrrE family metallo-endopeptidase [Alicyclobacillus sp. SO9]